MLAGSVAVLFLAAIVLLSRMPPPTAASNAAETADTDHDGVPDVYEAQKRLISRRVRTLTECYHRTRASVQIPAAPFTVTAN